MIPRLKYSHGERVRLGCGTIVFVHAQRAGFVRVSNAASGKVLHLPLAVLVAGDRLPSQGPPMQLVNTASVQLELFA